MSYVLYNKWKTEKKVGSRQGKSDWKLYDISIK